MGMGGTARLSAGLVVALLGTTTFGRSTELRTTETPHAGQKVTRIAQLGGNLRLATEEPSWKALNSYRVNSGQGFSMGFLVGKRKAYVTLRAGYRNGLPMDDAMSGDYGKLDDVFAITSGGTLVISVGTVAWLQFDLESFRELAGTRVSRLDAVPGVRIQPFKAIPLEAGAGLLISFKRPEGGGALARRYAGVFQILGYF
jgi:hypothetical protein